MAELSAVHARQFGTNVYMMAQQRGSKLRNFVTLESVKGKIAYFDRANPTSAIMRTSKYSDSPMIETKFDRRALFTQEYEWGDMIDWPDDIATFFDPTSAVVNNGAFALGRIIDDIIIGSGFTGVAYEGETGSTQVAFPSTQQIAVTYGTGSNCGLTIAKLRAARSLFGKADVDLDNPDNQLFMAVSQAQIDNLLATTEVTSQDYNNVKALVNGTIDTFLGFKFIQIERLPVASNIRTCVAWAKSGVKLALPQDITMRVTEREDKGFNWYAYAKMCAGCCRAEDKKVAQIFCSEA